MIPLRALLATPAYRTFWGARTLSVLGDAMANVAFVLLAARQGTAATAAWAVSLLLLAQTLPQTLGPFVGILADRMDRRAMMVGVNLAQCVLVAMMALLAPPFAITLVLVAALFLLATIFLPASQSVLPVLVPDELLGEANAWLRLGFNVGFAIGPVLAGFLVLVAGTPLVLLLDASSFLASALLLARLPVQPPRAPAPTTTPRSVRPELSGVWNSLREGYHYILAHPVARTVALGLFLVTLFIAVDNVGLVFLAEQSLGSGAAGYSALLSAYGVGMIVGPLLLVQLLRRVPMETLYWCSVLGMGAATLACGLSPTLPVAAIGQLLVGVTNGVENISYDTLLQRSVSPELRGRVFGAIYSAPYVALLITYSLGGLLLRWTSPRVVFVVGGAGAVAVALLLRALLPRRELALATRPPRRPPDAP